MTMSLVGCPTSDAPSDDTSTTMLATTTATATGTTTGTSTADAGTTGPVGDGLLQCVETCAVPLDCCTPGTPCPGPYPHNVDCIDGLCVPPTCVDDEDCAAYLAGTVCREVRGHADCVLPCTDDVPCEAADLGTCAGTDDEGAAFCFLRCDAPGEFCGAQTCDPASGLCVCAGDGSCQSDWVCID